MSGSDLVTSFISRSHQLIHNLATLSPTSSNIAPPSTYAFHKPQGNYHFALHHVRKPGCRRNSRRHHDFEAESFFSLPRELRDEIYDMLHQYEVETELGQLISQFRGPPVHVRLISRRFTTEFNMRTPSEDRAQLVISHQRAYPLLGTHLQPVHLPEVPTILQNTLLTRLNVRFHVSDDYKEIYTEMLSFHQYMWWVEGLLQHESRLVDPSHGGELHLQPSFQYVSNLELLVESISGLDWYEQYCTKIDMILQSVPKRTSTMERLGLHIYSDKPQTLATWSKGSDWRIEKVVSGQDVLKQGRLESLINIDPLEPWNVVTEADVEAIDWVALEDGNYSGMEGSGWDTDGLTVEQSRVDWNDDEGRSLDGRGEDVVSIWNVDDQLR